MFESQPITASKDIGFRVEGVEPLAVSVVSNDQYPVTACSWLQIINRKLVFRSACSSSVAVHPFSAMFHLDGDLTLGGRRGNNYVGLIALRDLSLAISVGIGLVSASESAQRAIVCTSSSSFARSSN